MSEITVQERRQQILDDLHNIGKVRVCELSAKFGVSEVSVRNDLTELEAQGLLSRVHGGAVSSYDSYYNMSLAQRSNTNKEEKENIAKKVAEMIHDNQSVMMNAGTTTLAVMKELSQRKNLTIVTNSIVLALEGSKNSTWRVVLLGGDVNAEYQFVYGSLTINQLKDYYADTLVLSVDGIDSENGISTYYDQEVEISKIMMQQSRTVIVACDYSKVERIAFCRIAPTEGVDCIVTNKQAPKDFVAAMQDKGIKTILANGVK